MKITSCFFIILLLTQTFSMKTEFLSLEKSKLGRTLLDMIQIHLASKEPIQALLSMLNDMSNTLDTDQEESDNKHTEFQGKCISDLDYYNTEIAESTDRITIANSDLESLNPEYSTTQQSLSDTQTNLLSLQEQLQFAQSQRESEAEEYALKVDEHENALSILHEAQSTFQELLASTSVSFLQKKTTIFSQVHGNIKKGIPKIRSGYKGIFKILAQIVQKTPGEADQDIVNKILDLIKKIKENVENSAEIEKEAEEQRIKAFEDLSAALEQNINNAQNDIQSFTNKLEILNASIQADKDEITQQTERLNSRQEQLADRSNECNDEDTAYTVEKNKRFFN